MSGFQMRSGNFLLGLSLGRRLALEYWAIVPSDITAATYDKQIEKKKNNQQLMISTVPPPKDEINQTDSEGITEEINTTLNIKQVTHIEMLIASIKPN